MSYRLFKIYRANSIDPDVAAHYELPHLDLGCFQIHKTVFSFLVFYVAVSRVIVKGLYLCCFSMFVGTICLVFCGCQPSLLHVKI